MGKNSLLVISLLSSFAFGQDYFNDYKTLQSSDVIPDDFIVSTKSKVEKDIETKSDKLSKYEKTVFYEGTNYAIDDILHSGQVVYGDEITNYASDIVDRLLKKDPTLRSELTVYTLKSNATNAFSTDQGIIFITTGLLSQIVTEAQLAFVLAHEIVHYKEKHVVETFNWKVKNYRYSDRVSKLSNYSKENEFIADKGAIKMYHDAGYPLEDIYRTFDVLMYSYLPFDEIEFPLTYFNDENMFVPESLFPEEKYEITAEEDYNDNDHSHPNIKKRKDSLQETTDLYSDWGDNAFFLGEDRFYHVRNIARFESVRSDLLEADYGEALYSIFLLEREFPNSIYLKRMKAQAWLNLLMYEDHNKTSRVVHSKRKLEGESASLHYFLKKMNGEQLTSLGLRQIYDLHNENPEDKELNAIYKRTVEVVAGIEDFKIGGFSKYTFYEAAESAISSDTTSVAVTEEVIEEKPVSKYDRIKRKKDVNNVEANFDSTKFYIYGMHDIISDGNFLKIYEEKQHDNEELKKQEEEYDQLSRYERRKMDKVNEQNRMKIGLEKVIVVEPKVFSSSGASGFDPVKSEEIENIYSEVLEFTAEDVGVSTVHIDRRTLEEKGTDGYNQRSVLVSFLNQIVEDEDIRTFPVDFQLLNDIRNIYGTNKVMFTVVEHSRDIDINWYLILGSAVIYPTFPFVVLFHIPYQIINSNQMDLYVLVMDIEKGAIEVGNHYRFSESLRKYNLAAHAYDILSNLHSNPQ